MATSGSSGPGRNFAARRPSQVGGIAGANFSSPSPASGLPEQQQPTMTTTGGGTYQGRKFTHGKQQKTRSHQHVKLSTVHQALEEDSAAVETLKRDVAEFQHLELETSRKYLVSLQKTFDKLKSEADAREAHQRKYQQELAHLDRLCSEARSESTNPPPCLAALQREIETEEDGVKDAVVQKDVFGHMIGRLSKEVLEARQKGRTVSEQLEAVERDIAASTLQLQTAKQEAKLVETKFEKLSARVAARRKMQESRLDGIQRVIAERSSLVEKQEERMKMREAVMARSKFDLGAQEEQRLKRMHVIRKVYSSMLEKKITAEEESLGALETTFQKIKIVTGLSDVDEIVVKFKERTQKTQQLQKLTEDLQRQIDQVRESNAALRERLASMKSTEEASSGNREVYKEMDSFNSGLGKARKHCEDARERARRSNVTLEQLKLAVARFRSKIEGKPYAVPDTKKLPEYLRELDSKLTTMMKSVSESLALEETNSGGTSSKDERLVDHHQQQQKDAGNNKAYSGGGGNNNSNNNAEVLLPFGKLQSDKLQKILYHKLMLTTPDQGPRNVRVKAKPGVQELGRFAQRKLLLGQDADEDFDDDRLEFAPPTTAQQQQGTSGIGMQIQQSSSVTGTATDHNEAHADPSRRTEQQTAKEDELRDPVVDRETVKRLSSLIVSREEPKKRRGKAHNNNKSPFSKDGFEDDD